MRRITILLAAALAAAALAGAGATTASADRVHLALFDRFAFKPRQVGFGAHGFVTGLRWERWGGRTAVGRGTFDYSDRTLSFRVPVRFVASHRRRCGTRRAYLGQSLKPVRPQDRRRLRAFGRPFVTRCP